MRGYIDQFAADPAVLIAYHAPTETEYEYQADPIT
jgi:hypothetical protein